MTTDSLIASVGVPVRKRWRASRRIGVLLFCAGFVLLAAGCSKKGRTIASIKESFDQGNYEEAIFHCRYALRKEIDDGEVYYYYGLSLLELRRDYEAFDRLNTAVERDRSLAPRIADALADKGRESLAKGRSQEAAERLKMAAEMNPAIALGTLRYLVADAYFNDKEFSRAAVFYRSAVKSHPDTTFAERAYFNLAECSVAIGDSAAAVDALEQQLEMFPRGTLSGQARWKLVNILYEHARSEFARGNYDVVVEEINSLLERTTNNSLVQRARFLLGEAYERMEDYENAYLQYQAIIDKDRGASGRIVERARAKIEAFRDSGLL